MTSPLQCVGLNAGVAMAGHKRCAGCFRESQDLNFKNIDCSTLPKLMDRQETLESSPRSLSRQCTLESTLETTEPSPFSRQCTMDSCFAVQVDASRHIWKCRFHPEPVCKCTLSFAAGKKGVLSILAPSCCFHKRAVWRNHVNHECRLGIASMG